MWVNYNVKIKTMMMPKTIIFIYTKISKWIWHFWNFLKYITDNALRWDVAVYSVIILRHLLCRPCWDTVTRQIAETHFNNTNLVRRTEEYNDIVDRCCCLISFGNISDDDPLKVLTSSALCQTTAAARKLVVCTWAFLRTVGLSYSSFPSFAFSFLFFQTG